MPPGPEVGTGEVGNAPGVGLGVALSEGIADGPRVGAGDTPGRASRATTSACGWGAKLTLDSKARSSGTIGRDVEVLKGLIQTRDRKSTRLNSSH